MLASTRVETPKCKAPLEITPRGALPYGVWTRVDASTWAALLTRTRLAIFQTLGAGIRSRGAVCAENGGLKISFSMQNYRRCQVYGGRGGRLRCGWPSVLKAGSLTEPLTDTVKKKKKKKMPQNFQKLPQIASKFYQTVERGRNKNAKNKFTKS
jgi:hypothetical protein